MRFKYILTVVVGILALSLLSSFGIDHANLVVNAKVIDSEKGKIEVKIFKGVPPYRLSVIFQGKEEVHNLKSNSIILKGKDKGSYFFGVTDSKNNVGSAQVKF